MLLIREGHLSVSGERVHTVSVEPLSRLNPKKSVVR